MFASLLSAFAGWGPETFAVLTGIVLALVNMKRMRPAGLFVLLGFIALLIVAILGIAEYVVGIVVPRSGISYSQLSTIYLVGSLLRLPFDIAGWALLLVGIFRKRSDPSAGQHPGAVPPGRPAFGQPPAPGLSPSIGQPPAPAGTSEQPGGYGQPPTPPPAGTDPPGPAFGQPPSGPQFPPPQ